MTANEYMDALRPPTQEQLNLRWSEAARTRLAEENKRLREENAILVKLIESMRGRPA